MCPAQAADWRKDFGVDDREPPYFFASKDQLTLSSPQAYAIRRAFDLLDLDGVLCTENSPLVYFKQVARITPEEVRLLHKKFWNHGSAPILVLITKDRISRLLGNDAAGLEARCEWRPSESGSEPRPSCARTPRILDIGGIGHVFSAPRPLV